MINIHGAYGRKYDTAHKALLDWEAGKDFKIFAGPYCSIRDKELMLKEYNSIQIFYGENLSKYILIQE